MKIYEKPMATIEKIDVEDVITTSGETGLKTMTEGAAVNALKTQAGTTEAIVFEW